MAPSSCYMPAGSGDSELSVILSQNVTILSDVGLNNSNLLRHASDSI